MNILTTNKEVPAAKRLPEPRPGDIYAALTELGLTNNAKGAADELFILCPYHQDRTIGSFSINLRTGLNACFSCGQGGSFHKFLMAARSVSRQEARRWCLQRLIVTTDTRLETITRDALPEINEASLALFTEPPEWVCEARRISVAACKAREILWKPAPGSGSWIFPIRDPCRGNQLLGWQEKQGHAVCNYPPGVPVKSALSGWGTCEDDRGKVALVESPLDVAVMWEAGFPSVLASYGATVSAQQLDFIEEKFSGLILAFDDDHAGWEATDKIMRLPMSIPRWVFQYRDTWTGKDPGELDVQQIQWGMRHPLC